MTISEIMKEIQNYLEGKYTNCNFYDDDRIKGNLEAIVDEAYDFIDDTLRTADMMIDSEIEDFNENYIDEARKVYIQNTKDDIRTKDNLECNLF